jgi:tetratricopeptide (TPR) repeat protein
MNYQQSNLFSGVCILLSQSMLNRSVGFVPRLFRCTSASAAAALSISLLPALLVTTISSAGAAPKRHTSGAAAPRYNANADIAPLGPGASPLDHNNRAVGLGRRGMWDQAVKEHEAALNGDPYNPTFRMNLSGAYLRYGQSLMSKGSWAAAIPRFHMALYVDPNNMAAVDCLNQCWKRSGKDPDNPDVRKELGEKYETEGNYPEAIAEYRTYVRIVDSGQAHAALGRALCKQGQSVPARAVEGFNELKAAVTKDWPKDQQMELGRAHLELAEQLKELAFKARDDGRTQTALKRLANAGIEYRRAATLMNQTNLEGARGLVEVAREAVAINPRSFDNHLMLAGGYQLVGDYERAKKEYEACWNVSPNNPKLTAARQSYHYSVVTSAAASPMLIAASVQKVEDLLRKDPRNAELMYIYARGKEALGDREVAMAAYQEAYKINPYLNADLPKRLGMQVPGTTGTPAVASAAAAGAHTPGTAGGALPNAGGFSNAGASQGIMPGAGAAGAPGGGQAAAAAAAAQAQANQNSAAVAQILNKINSGDSAGAQKDLLALLDTDPKNGQAWKALGTIQEKKGELDDASVSYRQASYLLKDDADVSSASKRVEVLRAQPYLDEGQKALSTKNIVGAKDAFTQATSVAPNDVDAHRKLLDVLKQIGNQKDIDDENATISKLLNPGAGAKPKKADPF